MKLLLNISPPASAQLNFLHFVHPAIGLQMKSSTRSSQIHWAVITRIFLHRAGANILETLETLRSSSPRNPHGRQGHLISRLPLPSLLQRPPAIPSYKMIVSEYHGNACGCDGTLPFCSQVVCSGWFWIAFANHPWVFGGGARGAKT